MNLQQATFGNGCFWCTEAVFQSIKGVTWVKSGYMGGNNANPTYKDVCSGSTGYAEVIHIEFDADVVTFDELLVIFLKRITPLP